MGHVFKALEDEQMNVGLLDWGDIFNWRFWKSDRRWLEVGGHKDNMRVCGGGSGNVGECQGMTMGWR